MIYYVSWGPQSAFDAYSVFVGKMQPASLSSWSSKTTENLCAMAEQQSFET